MSDEELTKLLKDFITFKDSPFMVEYLAKKHLKKLKEKGQTNDRI